MITGKLFIVIGLIVVVITALYLTVSLTSNPRIPLDYDLEIIKPSDYWDAKVTVRLQTNCSTLYNCHVELMYLTTNNEWKNSLGWSSVFGIVYNGEIGIVDYGETKTIYFRLENFKTNDTLTRWHEYADANIRVDAYGYLKP